MVACTPPIPSRDELIEQHLNFARALAHKLHQRLPGCVDVEELESDAYLGLLQTARSFDAGHGVLFRTYAARRINGAMLDGLRQRSGGRRKIPLPPVQSLDAEIHGHGGGQPRMALADLIADDSDPVGTEMELRDEAQFVMRRLDRSARTQLLDRHVEGLLQKDIGQKLGISASAVSQRMKRIRLLIGEIQDNETAERRHRQQQPQAKAA